MTKKLLSEELLKFSQVPDWYLEKIGHPIDRSTCYRWRTRGCRGVKLETILIGGSRFTSLEALDRFVEQTNRAAVELLTPQRKKPMPSE